MPHYPIGKVGRKGSLGSYYSIRDYRAVDPNWGRWPISTLLFGGLMPWE